MLPYCNSVNQSNKTIYINPNFRGHLTPPRSDDLLQTQSVIPKNAHINPLFLEAHKYRHTIHMNPAFLQKFQKDQHLQPDTQITVAQVPDNDSCCFLANQVNEMPGNTLSQNNKLPESRKIICKSKNRLIREPLEIKKIDSNSIMTQPPLLVLNKRKLIRKSSNISVAFKKADSKCVENSKARITKYKLDNRDLKKKALLPPTPRIKRTSYVGRYALRRSSMSQSSTTTSTKKRIIANKNKNKKLEVLNINGLLYKSTKNSLKLKTIAMDRPSNNTISELSNTPAINQISSTNYNLIANPGLTIFVRGTKYVMDANKFKLTRITNNDHTSPHVTTNNKILNKAHTFRRIDIGGYTYKSVNSAKNILIRTTNHLSRAHVHNAKLKSLQLLTRRLVKSNIPCPIFQRIGKCAAFERQKCSKVHNKLQIAICGRFLRGECLNTNCLLSHNVSLSKMPVCKFFLQGVCVRNDCPYLHKKLSNKAELCIDFLRGFCQMADKCNKRHEFVCPEIERNNVCSTKNCVFCNAQRRKELQIEKKAEKIASKVEIEINTMSSSPASSSAEIADNSYCKRYFIEPCDNEEIIKDTIESSGQNANEFSENNFEENFGSSRKSRPKLGILPSYIPL